MMKFAKLTAIAFAITSSAAIAQTTAPKSPGPATTTPSATMEPAADAKFKAADKDGNGVLSGAELTGFAVETSKIDTNKDGNVSREEFASAMKSGVIK